MGRLWLSHLFSAPKCGGSKLIEGAERSSACRRCIESMRRSAPLAGGGMVIALSSFVRTAHSMLRWASHLLLAWPEAMALHRPLPPAHAGLGGKRFDKEGEVGVSWENQHLKS